jgi:hypothetical protein
VRIHVLSASEEPLYFEACLSPAQKVRVMSGPHVQTRNGTPVKVSGYECKKSQAKDHRDLLRIPPKANAFLKGRRTIVRAEANTIGA